MNFLYQPQNHLRIKSSPKVPRSRSIQADVAAQAKWKASGLGQALQEAELNQSHQVWFSDEMRFASLSGYEPGLKVKCTRHFSTSGIKLSIICEA